MTTRVAFALDAADKVEFAAEADLWAAAPDGAAAELGMFTARVGPYTVVGCRAAAGTAMLNRVLGVGIGPVEPSALAEARRLLHANGCVCQVSMRDDAPAAADARAWLDANGFTPGYAWMRFVYPQDAALPVEPADANVAVRVCGPAEASRFGGTFARGYELPEPFAEVAAALVARPGWTCLLAETPGGASAGTGALFMADGAAWLGLGATVPALRGRGVQGAVLRARVREARRQGCRVIVTETGERLPDRPAASYRNILRVGFAEATLRPNYVAPPPP